MLRVVTPKPIRMTYHKLRSLQESDPNPQTGKTYRFCSAGFYIPKKDKATIKALKDAMEAAMEKAKVPLSRMNSRKFLNPLIDLDEEIENDPDFDYDIEAAKGHYFLNTKRYSSLPQIVNKRNETIDDPDDLDEILVAGYWYNVSFTARYFKNESEGIQMQLGNLQFMKKDTPMDANNIAAEKEFSDEGDDDEEEYDSETSDSMDDDPVEDEEEEEEKTVKRSARRKRRR